VTFLLALSRCSRFLRNFQNYPLSHVTKSNLSARPAGGKCGGKVVADVIQTTIINHLDRGSSPLPGTMTPSAPARRGSRGFKESYNSFVRMVRGRALAFAPSHAFAGGKSRDQIKFESQRFDHWGGRTRRKSAARRAKTVRPGWIQRRSKSIAGCWTHTSIRRWANGPWRRSPLSSCCRFSKGVVRFEEDRRREARF
jgi:hypothetical protein